MLRRIPLVVALALVVAAGCDQAPTAIDEATPEAPGFKVVDNFWLEASFSQANCLETVDADLRFHWLETYTESASGNYNYQWKFTVHGKGVGRDTGWEYVWNNSFDWSPHQHGAPAGYPYTESFTDNWVVIGKGQAPNWKSKVTTKFTVNGKGDVTVDFVKYDETCKMK
ncbi:MAG: hypothetical protein M8872_03975 [marine benthic group bacterium]|jgi:hypothetical protein|nr:hypothetical protein [Gemmatimonadota bacterium]MCL7976581.1 hypothetical protein [Gemmatimonadota bacterium]MCL7984399.1 hypothetical protein [Gemmatimonadota bacterium]